MRAHRFDPHASACLLALLALSSACSAARGGGGGDPADASTDNALPEERSAPTDTPATPDVTITPDVTATPDVTVTPDVTTAPDAPGVPCPSSIAGNGQPCALVGDGCGGGGGACADSYACTCNAAHRWQCITMPSTCDSGTPDVPASTCSLVGDYTTTLPGLGTLYLAIRADGQWRFASSIDMLPSSTTGGTYTVSGSRVELRETTTSLTGCTPTQIGAYNVAFSPGCAALTLTVSSDPCSLRATVLSGQSLRRL